MGNTASCVVVAIGMNDKEETIQLVRSDGTLQILQKPLAAAQVIQESPQCSVCHSDSFYIGQKTPTISPNEKLKVGNKYFLLPQNFFHTPLSLILLASIISPPPPPKVPPTSTARLSAQLRSIERASVFCQPFELQKSDVCGSLRIRVCPEFISKLMEDGRLHADERGHSAGEASGDDEMARICNTPELQKEFTQLVKCRGQCWRPKLETIKEKEKMINLYNLFFKIYDMIRT